MYPLSIRPVFARTCSRTLFAFLSATAIAAAVAATADAQQIADPNVNMVRGVGGVNGDPYLQRQNEGSLAVSTRNACHLLAGGNDYRTVDMSDPLPLPGIEPSFAGDAWLGIYKSFDCGAKWQSTLMPGYPQDTTAVGVASPLHGFEAAADAVVRSAMNGLFFFGGMTFNRVKDQNSQIFAARFIDNNNKERGDTIEYLDVTVLDRGTTGQFLDKPWLAIDVPRAGYGPNAELWAVSDSGDQMNPNAATTDGNVTTCQITSGGTTQQFRAGNAYMAWARFTGSGTPNPAKLMFARTTDCGKTWQVKPISDNQLTSQGATIAIAPNTGYVYVAWRQFAKNGKPNSIVIARSTDGGKTFSKPVAAISSFAPFDQAKTYGRFRTNALPTIAADDGGRVYIAVSARGFADAWTANADGTTTRTDDARIMIAVSSDGGKTFQAPYVADEPHRQGHQVMPSLTFAAGRLQLIYYDFREDKSALFHSYVDDNEIQPSPNTYKYRHTVEIMSAQAAPAAQPVFVSAQVSQYRSALLKDKTTGEVRRVTQLNPPDLPIYACLDLESNCRPFMGDYLDVAALSAVPITTGGQTTWFPNQPSMLGGGSNSGPFPPLPIFHAAWTDNRDVAAPPDGHSWHMYKAPGTITKDPNDPLLKSCSTAGMRNQNLYTSRITPGLYVGSPGNTKPLGRTIDPADPEKTRQIQIQRGFVVFLQNTRPETSYYALTIVAPADVYASWHQFDATGTPKTTINVRIPARTTLARTVYAKSDNVAGQFRVDVVEITELPAPGVTVQPKAGGLKTSVFFNGDPANPPILQPDFVSTDVPQIAELETHDPLIFEPRVTAVFKPGKTTAEIKNPTEENPTEENPTEENPTEENPTEENPTEENPTEENPTEENAAVLNPTEENPTEENPTEENPTEENTALLNTAVSDSEAASATVQDIQWKVKNKGNTTSAFRFSPVVAAGLPADLKYQLIITKRYYVPALNPNTCATGVIRVNEVLSNISNFSPRNPTEENPTEENPTEENPTEENPTEENSPIHMAAMSDTPDPSTPRMEHSATFFLAPGEAATVTLRIYDPTPEVQPTADANPYDPDPTLLPVPAVEREVAAEVSAEAANTGETQPSSAAAGPDLVLEDMQDPIVSGPVVTPAGASPASTVVVSGSVKNRGTADAIATVTPTVILTRIYFSADATLDTSDVLLATHDQGPIIPACTGPTPTCVSSFSQQVTVPVDAVTGRTYYFIITTDTENRIFEADEFNNTAVIPYTVGPYVLTFSQQPTTTGQNVVMAPVSVAATTTTGQPVTVVSPVTIALGSNPGGATLSGDLTQPNVAGLATFANLRVSAPGSGYTLIATAAGAAAATSVPFTVGADAPPVTAPDTYYVGRNTTLNAVTSVLQNDSDPAGQPITATLVSGPPAGHVLTLNADGTFTFTPATDFTGAVVFTYCAFDGTVCSAATSVTINVEATTAPPRLAADLATTFENVPVTVNVLANDGDPDGTMQQAITFTPAGAAANDWTASEAIVAPSGLLYLSALTNIGVVDPKQGALAANIPVTSSASFARADRTTGMLYFRQGTTIVAIDARPLSATFNQAIATINPLPTRVVSFDIDPVRHLLFAATYTVPVGPTPAHNDVLVYDVDPAHGTFNQVIQTVSMPFGGRPRAVAVNSAAGKVYVAHDGSGNGGIYVMDANGTSATLVTNTLSSVSVAVNESSNVIYSAGLTTLGGVDEQYVQAIDGPTGTLITTIPLSDPVSRGSADERLAIDGRTGRVFLKTTGPLIVIDGDRESSTFNQIVATAPVAPDAGGADVAIDEQAGTVVVVSSGPIAGAIAEVNAIDGTVAATHRVYSGASDVAINSSTHRAYVTGGLAGIVVLDTQTHTELPPIGVGAEVGIVAISGSAHKAYLARSTADGTGINAVYSSGMTANLALPHTSGRYIFLAADNTRNRAYAVNSGSNLAGDGPPEPGFISIIDAASDSVIGTAPAGDGPFGITVDPASNRIYVANLGGMTTYGGITIVNGAPPYTSTPADVSAFEEGVAFGRDIIVGPLGKVYARMTFAQSDGVNAGVLNPSTRVVTPLAASLGSIRIIRSDTTNNRVYVGAVSGAAGSEVHDLIALDPATDTEVHRLRIGFPSPYINTGQYVAIDETRNRIYVADYNADTLSVVTFDAASNQLQIVATIAVGDGPTAVAVDTAANRVYVSNASDRTLSIIDGASNTEVSRTRIPIRATALVVDSATQRVYASGVGPDHAGVVVLSDAPAERGVTLNVAIVGGPTSGTASVNADQTITYRPNNNFFGTDALTYQVDDGHGGLATSTVTVTVVHPNQPPVARNDTFALDENTTLTSIDNGVLDNDQDDMYASPTSLTTRVVTPTQHGTLSLGAHGVFTYTPAQNFFGQDSFVYEVSDPDGGSSQATATLIVRQVSAAGAQVVAPWNANNALGPISTGFGTLDALTADPDTGYIFIKANSGSGLQVNRYMAGSLSLTQRTYSLGSPMYSGFSMGGAPTLTVTARSMSPANGEIVRLDESGSTVTRLATLAWVLDPLGNGTGQLQIVREGTTQNGYIWDNTQAALYFYDGSTYAITQQLALDTGTPAGEHTATQHNDIAWDSLRNVLFISDGSSNTILQYTPGGSTKIAFAGLPGRPDAIATNAANGKVFVQIGTAIYGGAPEDGTMQLLANVPGLTDIAIGQGWGTGGTSLYALSGTYLWELHWSGIVTPFLRDDTFSRLEDTVATLPVLANDGDEWGSPLTIVSFTQPAAGQGTVAYGSDRRTLVYTPPAPNFTGTVTFTYSAAGFGPVQTATVTLTIAAVNDTPTAWPDSYQIATGTTLNVAAPGVLANDTDLDGPTALVAQYVSGSGPTSGTFSGLNADGSFSFSNTTRGYYSFSYRAFDGLATSQTWANIQVTDPLAITTTAFNEGVLFEGLGAGLQTSGGWGSRTFTLTSAENSLPRGISFNSGGWFNGSPLQTGSFLPSFRVADSSNPTPQIANATIPLHVSAVDQSPGWDSAAPTVTFGRSSRELAQVFSAGVQGLLTAIRVPNVTCPAGTQLTVQIQSVDGSMPAKPSGDVLASATATVPETGASYIPIVLNVPVPLPVETLFAVVFSSTGADCSATPGWTGNSYPMGHAFLRAPAQPWQLLTDTVPTRDDISATTLVTPDALVYSTNDWMGHPQTIALPDGRYFATGDNLNLQTYDPATGLFTIAGTMAAARYDAAAALLPGGSILLAGGSYYDGASGTTVFRDTAEVWHPDGTITPLASRLSQARGGAIAVPLVDGRVLLVGGSYDSGMFSVPSDAAEVFDPGAGVFTSVGPMQRSRAGHTATRLSDGRVLIYGGWWNSGNSSVTAELFDPNSNTFTPTATQSGSERTGHTATLLPGGAVLIAGGGNGAPNEPVQYLLFDPTTQTFTDAGTMLMARRSHSATLLDDGSVLIAGGYLSAEQGNATARVERWDPVAGITAAAPMQAVRAWHSGTVLNDGRVLFVGGSSTSVLTGRSAEVYNPSAALTITTGALPDGHVGVAYGPASITTNARSVTFSIAGGALPQGLTLNPSGQISGTPLVPGAMSFVVKAIDGAGNAAYQPLTLYIDRLLITTQWLPDGTVGEAYSIALDSTETATWSLVSGSLPTGLSLQPSGSISGNPTVTGWYSFMLRVTDSVGQVDDEWFHIEILNPLVVADRSFDDIFTMLGYGEWVFAVGGRSPYTWSLADGALPAGLTIRSDGQIGGTPQTTGTFAFTLRATDSGTPPRSATRSFMLRAGVLDQQYDPALATYEYVTTSQTVVQVLRTAVEGELLNAQVYAQCTSGDLVMSVYVLGGDNPDIRPETLLTQVTIPGAQLTPVAGMRQLRLPVPLDLPVGSRIALAFSSTGSCEIGTGDPAFGHYTNGQAFTGSGSSWTALPRELAFRTMMEVVPSTAFLPDSCSEPRAATLDTTKFLFACDSMLAAFVYDASTAQFTRTSGYVPFGRRGWSVTSLRNGRVLLAGGADEAGNAVDTAYLFDATTGTFSTLPSRMSSPRMYHTATVISTGQVLIAGGKTSYGSADLASTDLFDPGTETFTPGSSMSNPRAYHAAIKLNDDRVLLTGGTTSASTADLFTPDLRTVAQLTMASPVYMHSASVLPDGRVLIAGGYNPIESREAVNAQLFTPSPAGGTFETTYGLIDPRGRHAALALPDGRVLFAGGEILRGDHWELLSSIEIFDASQILGPTYSGFGPSPSLIAPRASSAAVMLPSGKVLVTGGGGPDYTAVTSSSAEVVDLTDTTLRFIAPFVWDGITGQSYTNTVYLSGGTMPYTGISLSAGRIPPGLVLDSSGKLHGTPTETGVFDAIVLGGDSNGAIARRALRICIADPLLVLTTGLPDANVGQAYNAPLQFSGGLQNVYVVSYSTPAGLTYDPASRAIVGTPAYSGTFTVSLTVQDSSVPPQRVMKEYSLTVR